MKLVQRYITSHPKPSPDGGCDSKERDFYLKDHEMLKARALG